MPYTVTTIIGQNTITKNVVLNSLGQTQYKTLTLNHFRLVVENVWSKSKVIQKLSSTHFCKKFLFKLIFAFNIHYAL